MTQRPLDLAQERHRAGRLAEAQSLYHQALAAEPNNAAIRHILGIVTCELGQWPQGIAFLRQAVAAEPLVPDYHTNLASALARQGQTTDAIASYRRALELQPDFAPAHKNLARILRALGQLDEAAAHFNRVVQLQPDNADAFALLAETLTARGQFPSAIAAARRAVALRPDDPNSNIQLGHALHLNGDVDESAAVLRRIAALHPENADAQNALANALQAAGDIRAAMDAFTRAFALQPNNAAVHSNLIYALHFDPASDPPTILRKHLEWNDLHAKPLRPQRRPRDVDRNPDRKLRIGFVSPDFCKHVVGRNILPLIRHRDASQFEIFCYSDTLRPDAVTEQFQSYADAWRDIVGLPDDQAAELICHDRIDILIDLALHMRGSRMLLFARKPAPLQATFAGYPSTTGVETIDYRLTDPYLDPPGRHDEYYSEKSLRLDTTFWCYDADAMEVAAAPEVNQKKGTLTFGCLNNFVKTNELTFQLWAKVLQALPDSRLILMSPTGEHRRRVTENLNIDPQRVDFVPTQPRAKYLEVYHQIDIGLDTFPYNGHTTSLDSFWMGVPVISLCGQTAVSRAGFSQAKNLGLADLLIAETPEDFLRKATDLARDLPRLADLRTLRRRMQQSPLLDAARFTKNVESACRQMWKQFTLPQSSHR